MSCHTNEEEIRARDEIENYQRFTHPNLGLIKTKKKQSFHFLISFITLL